ncbi:MAG TPA: hypothetical protein VGD02_08940 [Gemmatimonadaceae bacterium]|jgi:hypothetical protein
MSQDPQNYVMGSTNTVRLLEALDTDNGSSPIDWTVTLTSVLDSGGNPIAGASGLAMPFVAATTGFPACYKCAVPSTAGYVAGACTTRITATNGSATRRFDVPGTIVANN